MPHTFAVFTMIARGTRIAVVTLSIHRVMYATQHRVAPVTGTLVVVIAIHRLAHTSAGAAIVVFRTGVAVVAWSAGIFVLASVHRVTKIPGTWIGILAVPGGTCAFAIHAMVVVRAGVPIVAFAIHGCMRASCLGVTSVSGARVEVVTIDFVPHALVIRVAYRCGGAFVVVITGAVIPRVHASSGRFVAKILGTRVVVVAVVYVPFALPVHTVVVDRAHIAVVALYTVEFFVKHPCNRVTSVLGARIPVVRSDRCAHALAVYTVVPCGAYGVVVACRVKGFVHATQRRVAILLGANVVIVTVHLGTWDTTPFFVTGIRCGTRIVVVTWHPR